MHQGFSPALAHLLMAGLARRALLSAASRQDPRQNSHPLDWPSPVGRAFSANAGVASDPSDAFDWGIAAFLAGRQTGRSSVSQTVSAAEAD
jgi:hypothetical protein